MKKIMSLVLCSASCSFAAAALPFSETFEAVVGPIDGQNGWTATGTVAQVQSAVVHGGAQALELDAAQATQVVSSEDSSVWLRFQLYLPDAPGNLLPEINPFTSMGFYIANNLHVVVYSNAGPIELDVGVQTNEWTQFDMHCDYEKRFWTLAMNGTTIYSGTSVPLGRQIDRITLENKGLSSVYVDDIELQDQELAGGAPDLDGDGMPDWWEQLHFGEITRGDAGDDTDGDGNSALQEYVAGLNPAQWDQFLIDGINFDVGLYWETQPERLYSVYWAPSLTTNFTLLQDDIPWTQKSYMPPPTNTPASFFRLGVEMP